MLNFCHHYHFFAEQVTIFSPHFFPMVSSDFVLMPLGLNETLYRGLFRDKLNQIVSNLNFSFIPHTLSLFLFILSQEHLAIFKNTLRHKKEHEKQQL